LTRLSAFQPLPDLPIPVGSPFGIPPNYLTALNSAPNAHKGHDLTGVDPQTQGITRLFHPRHQVWHDHFIIQVDMQIEGITPEGRTTVRVLKMNDSDRVENRQILAEIGEYPCTTG
jgi:hypothetical protein